MVLVRNQLVVLVRNQLVHSTIDSPGVVTQISLIGAVFLWYSNLKVIKEIIMFDGIIQTNKNWIIF